MSVHSYSRVWVHLVWATLERRPLLAKDAAAKLSAHLTRYAGERGIYMKINFVNPDHVHALVDLPTGVSVEDMMHFLKGGSSHWVNQNALGNGPFGWGRGYGVFSVSHSGVGAVAKYIAEQEEHHRKRSYSDEVKLLVEHYGLKWRDDKTVETVSGAARVPPPR